MQEEAHTPGPPSEQQTSQGKPQVITVGVQLRLGGVQSRVDSWLPVVVMVPVDS